MRTLGSSMGLVLVAVAASCDDNRRYAPFETEGAEAGVAEAGAPEASAGSPLTVDCSHPGAGTKLPSGMCECPMPFDITGTWNGLYTCAEKNACVDKDAVETFTFRRNGSQVDADNAQPPAAATFAFRGTLCGKFLVWTGGLTNGSYAECGTLELLDADHYVKDSCYQYASDAGTQCTPTFALGCQGQSGRCTNTATRAPGSANPITKTICN